MPTLGIKQLYTLTQKFGVNFGLAPLWLILGGFVMGLAELVGVTAIFPMIMVIINADIVTGNNPLAQLYRFLGMENTRQFITLLGSGIAIVFILKGLFNIAYLHYEFKLLAQWRTEIASKIYYSFIKSPYSFFMQRNSSELMTVISTHAPNIVNHYIHPVINLFSYFMTAVLLVGYIIYLNWVASMVVMAIGGSILFAQGRIHQRNIKKLSQETSELQSKQYALLQQSFGGFKETRLHSKEDHFYDSFRETTRSLGTVEQKFLLLRTLPPVTVELVIMISVIVIFCVLMNTGSQLDTIAAQLGAMAMAGFRLIPLINRSITSLIMIHSGKFSMSMVLQECKDTDAVQAELEIEQHVPYTKSLTLKDTSYSYTSGTPILRHVNFNIKPGQFVGITGPSGSGKSTLAHILLGLITEFSGEYKIDDTIITKENLTGLHKIIGFVDQQIFLTDATIAENVAFGISPSNIDRERVIECLKKAQIWDFVQAEKNGIDTRTGELGKWLSGGQKQRLGIARALYRNLKILILDEASSALDIETEKLLFDFLNTLKGEISIIMIAHRLSTLRDCDSVDFMDNGTIVDSGTFSELYKRNDKFKTYIDYSQVEHKQ